MTFFWFKKKNKKSLLTMLLVTGAFSVLPIEMIGNKNLLNKPSVAQEIKSPELSTTQIEQIAKKITVKVITDDGGGSGVIIKKEGTTYTILTNEHVISDGKKYSIETNDGKVYTARLVPIFFQGNDLALLEFTSDSQYKVADLSSAANINPQEKLTKVYVSGFPFRDSSSSNRDFIFRGGERGFITDILSKPLKKGYTIGYTNEIEKGMSGGAILNEQGKLIGVNGIHQNPLFGNPYIYEDGETISEELRKKMSSSSWGVPVTLLAQFAPQYVPNLEQILISSSPSDSRSLSTSKIAQEVKNTAQQISVLISWETGNGSGVIIAQNNQDYYVLTARHVTPFPFLKITTHDGKTYQAEKFKQFNGVDLAILKFTATNKNYKVAKIADYDRGSQNRLIFVTGWPSKNSPNPNNLEQQREFTAGYLLEYSSGVNLAKDAQSIDRKGLGYELVYTNITQKGMSGGAILDTESRLIGIHTALEGDEGLLAQRNNEKIQQHLGYSLGIPISTFLEKLEQEQIAINFPSPLDSPPKKLTDTQTEEIIASLIDIQEPNQDTSEIDWLNFGNKLWRLRRYGQAQRALKQALRINQNFYQAWYSLGLTQVGDKKNVTPQEWQESVVSFQKATTLNPESDLAWRQLGDSYWYLGEYEKALVAFQKAIELKGQDFILYNWLADTYNRLGRYSEAIEAGNKSIEIKPDHAESYYRRAQTRGYNINDLSGALIDLNKAIELDPQLSVAYLLRANFLSQQNQDNYAQIAEESKLQSKSDQALLTDSSSKEAPKDTNKPIVQPVQDSWQEQVLSDYNKAIELDSYNSQYFASRGAFYAKIGNQQQFKQDFEQALRLAPDDAYVYQIRGQAYYSLGEIEKSVADYTEALRLAPEYRHEFFLSRGQAFHQEGKYEEAISDYTEAINFNPNFVVAYLYRGNAYSQLKEQQKAFQDFDKALQLTPKNSWIYAWRGDAYFNQGEIDKGYQEYQKAISLSSELADIYYNNRANLFVKLGEYPKAITDYSQAIKLKPNNYQYYLSRAEAYEELDNDNAVVSDYAKVIELSPNKAYYYNKRANLYYRQEQYEKSVSDYTKAISLNREDPTYYTNRASAYRYSGKSDLALKDYAQAIEVASDKAYYYNKRGNYYYYIDNYEKAIVDYSQAIKLEADDAVYYNNRGGAYKELKQYEFALQDYTKAIELDSEDQSYYRGRGLARRLSGDYTGAVEDYTKSIELTSTPTSSQYELRGVAYSFLADSYQHQGNQIEAMKYFQKAIADYDQAIKINSDNISAYRNRGRTYKALGYSESALKDFLEIVNRNPEELESYSQLTDALNDLKDQEKALYYYDQLIQSQPKNAVFTARLHWSRGKLYKEQKNYQQAISDYNQAINLDPQKSFYYGARADVQRSLKQYPASISDYEKGIELALANQEWLYANNLSSLWLLSVIVNKNTNSQEITASSFQNIPCNKLENMNKLWEKSSEGKFSLKVQESIYLSTTNQETEYDKNAFQLFGEQVGWRDSDGWIDEDDDRNLHLDKKGGLPQFPYELGFEDSNGTHIPVHALTLMRATKCNL